MSDTWILPKQLHTLASALDTAALSLDCNEQFRICEQSLFVRSKHSPLRTWLQKWKRDSWTQHLSGRILRPSLGGAFEAAWTSSLGDTLANRSAAQENGGGGKIQGTYGPTYQTAFGFFDQHSASLKTSKATLPKGCITSCATWESWVTEQRGDYSQRLNAVRHTQGNGSSSWPTISVNESKNSVGKSQEHRNSIPLGTLVAKSWPTPDASNHRDGDVLRKDNNLERGGFHGVSLHHAMTKYGLPAQESSSTDGSRQELWGTPRSCSSMAATITEEAISKAKSGTNRVNYLGNLETQMMTKGNARPGGKLNPRWVETLMGLPVGWTMPSCTSPVTIVPMNSGYSGMV